MLQAVLNGKAGRVEVEGRSVSWRELFQEREDLLTAAVFGRFVYLNEEVQGALLTALTGRLWTYGRLSGWDFWPHYDLTGSRVEPDVALEFDGCFLLIEVKPPGVGGQYKSQWIREIEAFLDSEATEEKELLFLAVGGMHPDGGSWAREVADRFGIELARVLQVSWVDVRDALVGLVSSDPETERITSDILAALELYGITLGVPPWCDLVEASDLPVDPAMLQTWKPAGSEGRIPSWEPLIDFIHQTRGFELWRMTPED